MWKYQKVSFKIEKKEKVTFKTIVETKNHCPLRQKCQITGGLSLGGFQFLFYQNESQR